MPLFVSGVHAPLKCGWYYEHHLNKGTAKLGGMKNWKQKKDMKKDLIEKELENVGVVCLKEKTNYERSYQSPRKKIDMNLHYT